ncbi:hydrogen gas-evolving membrane-bound hydrogenase subunit E [Gemella sp. zg-1178]|uniref:hydrogen gas-evolving membrane-bound hydrogenase subunit E n=1 Tax=Gemella sp. zg-1178 TaxID=2840372 RepID=UPI001C058852|nr:hydrogen gas-evolving membrane-bound hydrogenase subunit E [Gemella sp. zg-1178]MBU0278702.1 DUF4040 domain-containing protein [Gemella sp. zg-1178]
MLQVSILLPLLAIFLVPLIKKNIKSIHLGFFLLLVPLSLFLYFSSKIRSIYNGEIFTNHFSLASNIGLDLNLRLDGLSLLFVLLITGIGTLVILYSAYYMERLDPKLHKFYIFLMLFMSAMLGIVLSDNLLSMYMFWELTSVSSFLLISYWYENERSRSGALKSLIITVFGGVLMLLGIFILENITGSFKISEIINYSQNNEFGSLIYIAMILILIGTFTKSAQFPFHIWLPDAMVAPTPISSYLHSATMVKAGIYLLLRIGIVFSFTPIFANTLIIFGVITMLIGSINAVFLKDLKAILAYSTISQLGMMTLMIGIGNLGLYNNNHTIYTFAFYTVCFHIINHAVFKASLFMVTGIIDHTLHSRDISLIRGMRKILPASFVISILAAMSMAGVPPFSGFYSKEFLLTTVYNLLDTNIYYLIVIIMTILAAIGTFIYSMILVFKPFLNEFNPEVLGKHKLHIVNKGIVIAPAILALMTLANNFYKDVIVIPAQKSAVVTKNYITHINHESFVTKELITSIIIILVGSLIYIKLANKNSIYNYSPVIINIQKLYDICGEKLHSLTKELHDLFITNKIRRSMTYIFISLSATVIIGYFILGKPLAINNFSEVNLINIIISIGIVICCIFLSFMTNRLVLIMTSSGIGFMMTALYVTFRAPDLAMTQFVIESISTIIFLIAFIVLTNKTKHIEKTKFKLTNAVIAILSAISFIIVGLVSYAYKNPSVISPFYSENVIPSGGGNIVNVIIVDFRGFDTLFEITVMSMVALIIYSMFKIIKKGGNKDEN